MALHKVEAFSALALRVLASKPSWLASALIVPHPSSPIRSNTCAALNTRARQCESEQRQITASEGSKLLQRAFVSERQIHEKSFEELASLQINTGTQLCGKSAPPASSEAARSVAAGAYGAHGLKVEEMYKTIWRTAVQYHQFSAVSLLAVAAVPSARARLVSGAGICLGAAGFSGSNYAVAFYQDRSLAKLGPYGGMSLIGGWLALTVL